MTIKSASPLRTGTPASEPPFHGEDVRATGAPGLAVSEGSNSRGGRLEGRAGAKEVRESSPRQADKKSRGPQGDRGLEFNEKDKLFSSLYIP